MKKVSKRTLSLVLALSLVMTLFAFVPAMAHPNSAALVPAVGESALLDFNFKSGVAFKGAYDFGNGLKLTHSLPDWVNKVEQTNRYLEIGKKDAGTRSRFTIVDENWETGNLTKDRYLTEFRFKLNELTPIQNLFRAELCAGFGSIDWAASSPYVWVGVVASNGKYYLKAGDTTISAVPLETGIWYNVKMDINIKERKFDFYLDGALRAVNKGFTSNGSEFNKQTGKAFNSSTDNAEDKLAYWDYLEYAGIEFPNKFNRIFYYQDDANTPDICFDDIRVYKEPTGVITYGADDFSSYKEDIKYDGSKIYQSFAGLALRTDAKRQCNFTIDAENGYAISGTGKSSDAGSNDGMQIRSNLFDAGGALYKPGNYKENSLVTEFKITPKTNTVGVLSFYDNLANQYGIDLEVKNNSFIALYGKKGEITTSNFKASKNLGSYEIDKTYKIKICMDLNRSFEQTITDRDNLKRTLPGICDIYIDDKLVLSDAAFCYQATEGGDTPAEGLGNMLLRTNGGCQAYFDDFKMYSDEKEEVLSRLAIDMHNAYANGMISSDTIALPQSYTLEDRNTYNIDWTSSSASIINPETGAVDRARGGNVSLTAKIYYEGEEDYNLTNEFDFYVVPELSKDVVPVDYEINSITFADAEGNRVYGPMDGGKLTGVTVKKNADFAADLYAVVYDGDSISGVDFVKNFADGAINLDLAVSSASDVRFFIWSADGAIKPLISPVAVIKEKAKLFILADSIYDETPPQTQPSTGVGYALKAFYNQDNLEIVNLAECGMTLKTFAQSGRFADALSQIKSGDYVLISFCHNDQKWPKETGAEPLDSDGVPSYDAGSYEYYLEEYIEAIRLKGGIPVIATSVPRWEFDGDTPTSTHGNYYNAARNVANYTKVPLLDVYAEAIADMTELGAEASKAYYLEPVDENGDGVYDKTHMTEAGAAWVAGIIADLADSLKLPFSAYRISE